MKEKRGDEGEGGGMGWRDRGIEGYTYTYIDGRKSSGGGT